MGGSPHRNVRAGWPRSRRAGGGAFVQALERTEEITLTVTGRSSGREIFHPVWFVQERRTLYLLPVSGSDSAWFKNVVKTPTIRLAAGRATLTARAKPVRDRARLRDVVEKFRAKYGVDEVKKYYSKFDVAVEVALGG
jgi:hypothetical protein